MTGNANNNTSCHLYTHTRRGICDGMCGWLTCLYIGVTTLEWISYAAVCCLFSLGSAHWMFVVLFFSIFPWRRLLIFSHWMNSTTSIRMGPSNVTTFQCECGWNIAKIHYVYYVCHVFAHTKYTFANNFCCCSLHIYVMNKI